MDRTHPTATSRLAAASGLAALLAIGILCDPAAVRASDAPQVDEATAAKAEELLRAGDVPGACTLLDRYSCSKTTDATTLRLLGVAKLMQHDLDPAIDLLQRAVDATPDDPHSHAWLARALSERIDAAGRGPSQLFRARRLKAELLRTLELAPDHLPARQGLVRFYDEAPRIAGGGKDKADEQVQQLIKFHPREGHLVQSRRLESRGDLPGALAECQAALAAAPGDVEATLALGLVEIHSGHVDEGRAALETARLAAPDGDPRIAKALQSAGLGKPAGGAALVETGVRR